MITGPDCASLTPFRCLQIPAIYNSCLAFVGYFKILTSTLRMERRYQTHNALMHVVGMYDARKLQEINPDLNVIFYFILIMLCLLKQWWILIKRN